MPYARLSISTPLVCTSRWYVSTRRMRVRVFRPLFGVDFVQRARNTRLKPSASLAFSKEPNSARFGSGTAGETFSSRPPTQLHKARRFSPAGQPSVTWNGHQNVTVRTRAQMDGCKQIWFALG